MLPYKCNITHSISCNLSEHTNVPRCPCCIWQQHLMKLFNDRSFSMELIIWNRCILAYLPSVIFALRIPRPEVAAQLWPHKHPKIFCTCERFWFFISWKTLTENFAQQSWNRNIFCLSPSWFAWKQCCSLHISIFECIQPKYIRLNKFNCTKIAVQM